jgi:DNA-binding XRE family transcriptional regulator
MTRTPFTPTFLMDATGKRTHAILPYEEWELLTARPVQPDALDLKTIARLERDLVKHPGEFEESPIGNPIRRARLGANVRQEDLASALGISQPALSKLEREGHQARPATIARALAALAGRKA